MEQTAPVRRHSFFHNLWENFVYSGNKTTTSNLVLSQIFFINTFAVLGFIAAFTFGLTHFSEKNYGVAISEILGACFFLSSIIFLRLGSKIIFSKAILVLTQGGLLIIMLITGGVENTGIFWYFTFPVAAFFLLEKINGIILTLCLCIVTLFVFVLSSFGYFSIAYTFVEIRQMLVSLFVTAALIYLYQNSIEKTATELRQQANQLKITKRGIEQAKVEDDAILASIGEGMIALGTGGRVLIINNAAVNILNLLNQNALGQDVNSLFQLKDKRGKDILLEDRLWKKVIKNGEKVSGEFICIRNDKTEFPISVTAAPVVLNGQTIGVIELFRDITEEKKLDQAKSEFVTLASHQLRTPISAISWFTEMMLSGDAGELSPEIRDQLIQVYRSNQRMAKLVDALLNVSSIEMGNFYIKPVLTDLAALSHRVLFEETGRQKPAKPMVIKEYYDKNLPNIMVDQDFMKIIFQSIFSNALKYTPENGKITVELFSYGQNSPTNGNNYSDGILFKVSDTGYGIPKNQENKIFTKLFRADNVKIKDTDGTGLNLYVVKSILDEVGGKIWFESEENVGTTFFVWLPKAGMQEKQGEKTLIPMSASEGGD